MGSPPLPIALWGQGAPAHPQAQEAYPKDRGDSLEGSKGIQAEHAAARDGTPAPKGRASARQAACAPEPPSQAESRVCTEQCAHMAGAPRGPGQLGHAVGPGTPAAAAAVPARPPEQPRPSPGASVLQLGPQASVTSRSPLKLLWRRPSSPLPQAAPRPSVRPSVSPSVGVRPAGCSHRSCGRAPCVHGPAPASTVGWAPPPAPASM